MRNKSRGILHIYSVALLLASAASISSFADDYFTPTSSGTFDANAGGNWSAGVPSNNGVNDDFTETFSGSQTATNFLAASNNSTINYLIFGTGGSGTLTVITASGDTFNDEYGGTIGANDKFVINGSRLNWSFGNNSFGDSGGTLVLSNFASIYVDIGANAVQNTGTIIQYTASNQTNIFNYGQSTGGVFNNSGTGTIIQNGSGVGQFQGQYSANNIGFVNNGTIIVNGGTLAIDTGNAYSGPFINNGTVSILSGATFDEARSNAAWTSGIAPTNTGTIFLNGGTLTASLSYNNGGPGSPKRHREDNQQQHDHRQRDIGDLHRAKRLGLRDRQQRRAEYFGNGTSRATRRKSSTTVAPTGPTRRFRAVT